MEWELFFSQGTPIIALPHWQSPHLYIPARTPWQRWQGSYLSFYLPRESNFWDCLPSGVKRYGMRLKAALGLLPIRIANSSETLPLYEFVEEIIPQMSWAVIIVGVLSPAPKLVIQIWDRWGRIVGYLKYGEQPTACRQIQREYEILTRLDREPKPLKCGTLGKGTALLLSPVSGKPLPGTLPPVKGVSNYLQSLTISQPIPLERHPWIQNIREYPKERLDRWLDALSGRDWPIAVHHGDFHSRNILRTKDRKISAIDWEYGTLEGFPHLDLANYFLMLGKWTYQWSPKHAIESVTEVLSDRAWTNLTTQEAKAIVGLTAYTSYQQFIRTGYSPNCSDQSWRQQVWQS